MQAQPRTDGLLDGAGNFLAVKPAPVGAQRNAEKLGRFCWLQAQAKKTLLKFSWRHHVLYVEDKMSSSRGQFGNFWSLINGYSRLIVYFIYYLYISITCYDVADRLLFVLSSNADIW